MGSILIDDQDAIKAITKAEKKARNSTSTFDKMADAGMKIGTAFVAGAAVAGTALVGLVGKGMKSADDLAGAINGVEAATGLADDSTTGFRDAMLDIYNNNFGDSFEDIGAAMAEVNKQTGLTGESLKETTEYALMMRDTFDMEVNESIRTAEMMMDQFGITSEEAYNLIAQGAQNGLDKNGDLLDTVNEYSGYFEGMGINADEMFNMLKNGAEDGTFSVDKLGDAMKEFSIRSIDGSDATSEAFENLGFDAGNMADTLAAGGEGARDSLFKIADALFEMEDPVERNKAGVALFGTQWEDLGEDGVNALLNVNGEMDSTKASMDEINNKKYDTVGEAIQGIGRNLETGILVPIGEKVLPIVQNLADKFQEKMPLIREKVETAFNKVSGVFDAARDSFDTFVNSPLVQSAIDIFQDVLTNAQTLGESPVWGTIKTVARDVADAILAIDLQSVINDVQTFLDKWSPLIAGIVVGIAVFKGLTFVAGIIGTISAAGGIMAVVMSAVATASAVAATAIGFLTSPITLTAAAIAAVIAIGILLWKNWDTVTAKANELRIKVANSIQNMKNAVIGFFQNLWAGAVEKVQGMATSVSNKVNEMKNNFTNRVQEIKNGVTNKFTEIKNGITSRIRDAVSNVKSKFSEVYDNIMSPVNRAKDAVSRAIDKIKGFFDFTFRLPHIPKPSFGVSPSGWKIGDLLKGSIPKLSVNWNAKGGIFDEPTIFNTSRGLQGVGEAGPEAILPLNDKTYAGMGKGIADALSKMVQPQRNEKNNSNRPIVLQIDGKTFAEITGDYFGAEGGTRIRRIERGLPQT